MLYRADNPRGDVMIDRGLMNWLIPGLLIAAAVLLGWLGLWMRRGAWTGDAPSAVAATAPR